MVLGMLGRDHQAVRCGGLGGPRRELDQTQGFGTLTPAESTNIFLMFLSPTPCEVQLSGLTFGW